MKFYMEGCVSGAALWTRIISLRYFHTLIGSLRHLPRGQITYFHNNGVKMSQKSQHARSLYVNKPSNVSIFKVETAALCFHIGPNT